MTGWPARGYRGRFAPSPTGPLHLGSLVAALGSFLDARAHHGRWLVRIEDIDPPREQPLAREAIVQALSTHGLPPDEPVIRQSSRTALYRQTLLSLQERGYVYACPCSRQELQDASAHRPDCGFWNVPCREGPVALRFRTQPHQDFMDCIQGERHFCFRPGLDDFVLWRKENLPSYQLAVVTDDHLQGITHVIRGLDLLDSTPLQLQLYAALDWTPPIFGHIPIVTDPAGKKLSKQNLAPALSCNEVMYNLRRAGEVLRLGAVQEATTPGEFLEQAVCCWNRSHLQGVEQHCTSPEPLCQEPEAR